MEIEGKPNQTGLLRKEMPTVHARVDIIMPGAEAAPLPSQIWTIKKPPKVRQERPKERLNPDKHMKIFTHRAATEALERGYA